MAYETLLTDLQGSVLTVTSVITASVPNEPASTLQRS